MRKTLIALMFAIAMSPLAAAAATQNLAWDANTETDLAGYKLHQGVAVGGPYVFVKNILKPTVTATSANLVDGSNTFVVTAYDTAGNESGYSNEVLVVFDGNIPIVTAFTIQATSNTRTIPITTFTATDTVGVTGYLVTESAVKPLATAIGWSAAKPASYAVASDGSKTLYAWAKDAAGNVSAGVSAVVTVDTFPPVAPRNLRSAP